MKSGKPALIRHHQLPVHLQFNKYVLDHYRPPSDTAGCLKSMFYLHNETVNILTHAIPIFVILYSLSDLLPWGKIGSISYLPQLHIIAFLAPWVGSTAYHLFMNHHTGRGTYSRLLCLDMIGIWVAQNLGSLVCVCATVYCFEETNRLSVLAAYAFACCLSCFKAMTARDPWERRFSFLSPFFFRIAMLTVRITTKSGGHPESVVYLIAQDIVAIIGGFIGASNIPERWCPGKLDLALNSHNIMHVLVVAAACLMHKAVSLDLEWMAEVNEFRPLCDGPLAGEGIYNESLVMSQQPGDNHTEL